MDNVHITSVNNHNFAPEAKQYLTKIFTTTVEQLVPTQAREVWLHLNDFENSKKYNLNGLLFMIIRKTVYNQQQWHGIVQGDKRRLKLIAVLENNQ